jgi:hypothetical protein
MSRPPVLQTQRPVPGAVMRRARDLHGWRARTASTTGGSCPGRRPDGTGRRRPGCVATPALRSSRGSATKCRRCAGRCWLPRHGSGEPAATEHYSLRTNTPASITLSSQRKRAAANQQGGVCRDTRAAPGNVMLSAGATLISRREILPLPRSSVTWCSLPGAAGGNAAAISACFRLGSHRWIPKTRRNDGSTQCMNGRFDITVRTTGPRPTGCHRPRRGRSPTAGPDLEVA